MRELKAVNKIKSKTWVERQGLVSLSLSWNSWAKTFWESILLLLRVQHMPFVKNLILRILFCFEESFLLLVFSLESKHNPSLSFNLFLKKVFKFYFLWFCVVVFHWEFIFFFFEKLWKNCLLLHHQSLLLLLLLQQHCSKHLRHAVDLSI